MRSATVFGLVGLFTRWVIAQDERYFPVYIAADRGLPRITGSINEDDIDLIQGRRVKSFVENTLKRAICRADDPISIALFDQGNLELHVSRQEIFPQHQFVKAVDASLIPPLSLRLPLSNVPEYSVADNLSRTLRSDCGGVDDIEVRLPEFSSRALDVGTNQVKLVRIPLPSNSTDVPQDAIEQIQKFINERENTSPRVMVIYTSNSARLPPGVNDIAQLRRLEANAIVGGTFWTPGIWMTLGTTLLLALIVLSGVRWITSVQSHQRLEAGSGEDKKNN